MLKDVRRRWSEGARPTPAGWTVRVGAVGMLVAGLAWLVLPFLARGHGMVSDASSAVDRAGLLRARALVPLAAQWSEDAEGAHHGSSATASMVIAPVYFALRALGTSRRTMAPREDAEGAHHGSDDSSLQPPQLWVLDPMPTGATLVLVMGVGQVVALMWLIQVLRSAPHQGLDVDIRAS